MMMQDPPVGNSESDAISTSAYAKTSKISYPGPILTLISFETKFFGLHSKMVTLFQEGSADDDDDDG